MKIFRKIRERLLQENKLTRYFIYGIGEIILVVIGILIAVAINNSNIQKLDNIKETKYLKNIKLDLQKDLINLDFNIAFRTGKYEGTKKLIKQINGQAIEDVTELTINIATTLMEERFTPNNSTYNELASSGNLNLISNESIKVSLLELEELYKKNNFAIEHETFDYREYISKPLFNLTDTEQLLLVFSGQKTAEQQGISSSDFAHLFQSLEYKNGLVITNNITQSVIKLYETIETKSKKIIELIDLELKQR
jgi:hypothetical protein